MIDTSITLQQSVIIEFLKFLERYTPKEGMPGRCGVVEELIRHEWELDAPEQNRCDYTTIVTELEKSGLIERKTFTLDGRDVKCITFTPQGLEYLTTHF